jgi:hypothetical protein
MRHAALPGMGVRCLHSLVPLVAISIGACADAAARDAASRDVREMRETSQGARSLCTPAMVRHWIRQTDAVAFVGTAAADTVLAGAGLVSYVTAPDHRGRRTDRAIYGQIARVDRLERAAAASLRDAIMAADSRVVLVRWDLDPACDVIPWPGGARWMTPGAPAVHFATLRDRVHWVGRRPTFDVMAETDSYDPAVYPRGWGRDSVLSADEFLTYYERLPDYAALTATPDSAVAPVIRWVQEHPELARRPLVSDAIGFLLLEAEARRYKSRSSAIAGTYHVVYRTASGDSVVFFARTEQYPDYVHWSGPIAPADSGPFRGRRILGHSVIAQAAPTLADLPTQTAAYRGGVSLGGSIQLTDAPIARSADSAVFKGMVGLDGAAELLAPDTATRLALAAARKRTSDAAYDEFKQSGSRALGRFVMTSAGRLYFDMRVERAGVHMLTIHAERISGEYMKPVDR